MYPKHYFDLFREDIDLKTVFVGIDFGDDFRHRREDVIIPAISDAGFRPTIVNTSTINESIHMDILRGVKNSELLLFEISMDSQRNRNGNTLYELGLAHAIRLPEEILVLREDDEKLLFDIAPLRTHQYKPTDVEGSRSVISELLKGRPNYIDRTKLEVIQKTLNLLDDDSLRLMDLFLQATTHFSINPASLVPPE